MHTGMSYSNKRLKTEAYYTSVKEKATIAPPASLDNSGKCVLPLALEGRLFLYDQQDEA
jgi:hypothetical protein